VRRIIAIGVVALLVLAVSVPLTSAGTTPVTKHVDGTIKVYEPALSREWLARFEVRTTSGVVQFGYLELYGLTGEVANPNEGQIHEYSVKSVDYHKTPTGAQGATLHMEECIINPPTPCFDVDYHVSDGGSADTFLDNVVPSWQVVSGNISIYSTGGQNGQ
jgi:hypothetical protein